MKDLKMTKSFLLFIVIFFIFANAAAMANFSKADHFENYGIKLCQNDNDSDSDTYQEPDQDEGANPEDTPSQSDDVQGNPETIGVE